MLRKMLEKVSVKLSWLIILASLLYTTYQINLKLASENFAGNLNGLHVAPWVTIIAVSINICFYGIFGCFNLGRLKEQWLIFLVSGLTTSAIVNSGVITTALKAVSITEASTLTKATAVPASLLATILLISKERGQLLRNKYQMIGGALALCAIVVNLMSITARMSGLPMFVFVLTGIYALASFIRTPLIRKNSGDPLGYAAGDQLFASMFVYGFCAFLRWGNFSFLPQQLVSPFMEMRTGLSNPNFKMLGWAFVIALPFAIYAPTSILILMYKKNDATALVGSIMQKLVAVVAAVLALPTMHLVVWLFFDVNINQMPWYNKSEILGLGFFVAATIISIFPQIKEFFKNKFNERGVSSSKRPNSSQSGGRLQASTV
jgi:hypothetical protein